MQIYDTLTRKKVPLIPIEENHIRIYACGPTVYNYIHIGNARPICAFDVLRRYLQYRGYQVTYVQNFTDIDDKIIRTANETGVTAAELAERFIAEYKTDAHGLNVMDADVHPRVTESMDLIIDLVQRLVDKGHAYAAPNGDVYFRTDSFPEYGKLSGQPMEALQAGARIEVEEEKENPLDFAVWKAAKPGEPYWESPWGNGRPGWHIECSAMSCHYLGETFDLHCGGQDLIFSHHENEIAQAEAANEKPFVHYWMHNGYINIDSKKMSKSLGNFFTVREVAEQYGYEVIRYMMVQAHYRSPINYCKDLLDACKASLDRLYTCRDTLSRVIESAQSGTVSSEDMALLEKRKTQFITAMDDDLNTADGMAAVFELVRDLNRWSADASTPKELLEAGAKLFSELTGIMGLLYDPKQDSDISLQVMELVEQRAKARQAKDFATADALREKVMALGYSIQETRQGTEVKKTR
ncbi:MAG: cysteine--tRNA ligase [Ruminococcus sp.]|nr:cysteine--tRNA ligase [Ruminococcus sp.]